MKNITKAVANNKVKKALKKVVKAKKKTPVPSKKKEMIKFVARVVLEIL